MRTDDTAELVAAARDGNKNAFAVLIGRTRSLLVSLCGRLLRDPNLAEDAAQEAFLRALLSIQRLQEPSSFGPWLVSIGLNVCRQWLRHRARDAWSLDALVGGRVLTEPIDWSGDVQTQTEDSELATCVRDAVGALPPVQRAAVAMFYLAGLSHAETLSHLASRSGQ